MNEEPHLRLAGVTRLSVKGMRRTAVARELTTNPGAGATADRREPFEIDAFGEPTTNPAAGATADHREPFEIDAFVFDPHRLALPSWAVGLEDRPAATLLTLDRHFDLVAPTVRAPRREEGLRALDEYARWSLDVRNYDHVLAAMEAGLIADAVVVARFVPRGAMREGDWTDGRGVLHRIIAAESLASLPSSAIGLLKASSEIILDVDLDCFTTPLVEDPTSVAPWSREEIRRAVLETAPWPEVWNVVLPKTRVFTFAREPFHCGGLVAGGRLFEDAATVFFEELFGADAP